MKKIVSAILIIGISAATHAQKSSTDHWVFSLDGGIASPLGNFGKADYADEKSGFAKTGGHINVSAVYYVNKNFGIGILGGYSLFGFSSQSLADGYKEDSGTDSTTLYKKGNNKNLSILIGPYYSIPVNEKFSVDFRVLAGYVKTHLSGFQVYYEDYTDNVMTQRESSAAAFGFQAGGGLTYKITKLIRIKFNADYLSSKPTLAIHYDNFIVNAGRRLDTYNQSLSGINTTLGIAISLR